MSKVNTRSFTVPQGSRFVCTPLDGYGPIVAHEGETVMVIVARSYETAVAEALMRLHKPEPSDE